jgi:hypothetical protein
VAVAGVDADVDVRVRLLEASMRGISHIDAKLDQVVIATLLRPAVWRTWRTAASMRSTAGPTVRSNCAPALVSSTARVAQEEGDAHLVLQRLDLAAHRRLGECQFLGRSPKVQVPRHAEEGAPVAHPHGAGAQYRAGRCKGAHGAIDAIRESIA